jgi:hypothetical protein
MRDAFLFYYFDQMRDASNHPIDRGRSLERSLATDFAQAETL